MLPASRRAFLRAGSAALIYQSACASSKDLFAQSLHVPLGLQLYSFREQLPKDYAGTLREVGGIGYKEVEAAGYYDHSVAEVKQVLSDAGLKLVSAHYSSNELHTQIDEIIDFNKRLDVHFLVCSSPGYKDPSAPKNPDRNKAFTLEDWRWNAEEFNKFGEKVAAAGMQFGYHNHTMEFHKVDGVVPYEELLRLTDPAKVTMEMDCGWVTYAGASAADYLRKYPRRVTMLHVKDFKSIPAPDLSNPEKPQIAELGQGKIDYRPILEEAAKHGYVKHCFVEQEAFNVPPVESLTIDANYMRKLGLG
jgi:sugar phosphate isomerase/epimerase